MSTEPREQSDVSPCTICDDSNKLYLEHEVRRRAWLDCLSEDAVVVRVDERLVQVQHQHLPPNQT